MITIAHSFLLTVPNVSPNLKPVGYNTSSTSLNISWKAIARPDINGVLRGYALFWKPSSSDEGARNITVPPDKLSVHLTGLAKYTEYELRVAGVTSKGTGGMSVRSLVYTDEDGKMNTLFTVDDSFYMKWHNLTAAAMSYPMSRSSVTSINHFTKFLSFFG